jgi:3'5'-cyclic nucleotide phosphodiesterase
VTYHNSSPLENMHAAVLVRLMLQPSLNFLSHLPGEVFKAVRKYAVSAILCTDPAAHRLHMDTWAKVAPKWQKTVAYVQQAAGAGLAWDMRDQISPEEARPRGAQEQARCRGLDAHAAVNMPHRRSTCMPDRQPPARLAPHAACEQRATVSARTSLSAGTSAGARGARHAAQVRGSGPHDSGVREAPRLG